MKLLPLETYRTPQYPTQDSVREESDLLRELPKRWRGKRAVLGALAGALALMNQSCSIPFWVSPKGRIAIPRSAVPEDEAKATIEQESRSKSQRSSPKPKVQPTRKADWAAFPGDIAIPRSVTPEDQAKAAADQAAKGQ